MKIAIVDDLPDDRAWLVDRLAEYCRCRGIEYALFEYESGEAFVAALKGVYFDIVFMDIYMNGMSGLSAAGELRRTNMDARLVLLTSSPDHFREGYDYNTCYYLLKSERDEAFTKAMALCRVRPPHDVPVIEVRQNKKPVELDTGKIIYIDVEERGTKIHLYGAVLPLGRVSFAAVTKPLESDRRFLLCIQGVLVNMDWISDFGEDTLLLKTGERLPIATRSRKALWETYQHYLFHSMMNGGPA